ncbi:MAG: alpha/beta hydrolase [Polyangiales bacterium]
MDAEQWRARGKWASFGGRRLFYVDTGGDKPVLAILHGYPTSSYDYWRALPRLAERHRVVVHDHLGFGFSAKPLDYSYSLFEQADHAIMLWQSLGITEADVVGHDYGTSISTELIARRNLGVEPITFRSLTLCNGSMHIEMAKLRVVQRLLKTPRIGEVLAKLASEPLFRRNIRNVFADKSFLDDQEIHEMYEQMMGDGGRDVAAAIIRYIDERWKFWHRWIGALRATHDLPVHIVWAREDPVAVEQMAHVLHDEIPSSDLRLLDGVGHFPMIEAAERWSDAVLDGIAPAR